MDLRVITITVLTYALTSCASAPSKPKPQVQAAINTVSLANANMAPVSGTLVSGRLTLTPIDGGIRIEGQLGGLGRGATHAIHIHERGDCSAADGSSAGGHFNPAAAAHGRMGTAVHHLGDMDNIVADAAGVAQVDVRVISATMGSGAAGDILGRAIIVHAGADDYVTQPTGNSGARVACGVIRSGS